MDHRHIARSLTAFRDPDSDRAPADMSRELDAFLTGSLKGQTHPGILLLAVGGYGRGELFPHSDVDLLLLVPKVLSDQARDDLASTIFLPLWDAGFDLGHGVRTEAETLDLAARDFEVLCSLLEMRLLAGSKPDFEAFSGRFRRILAPLVKDVVRWLAERSTRRRGREGLSDNLLSPDLKNGPGGLRDLQTISWLTFLNDGATLLNPDESTLLVDHARFLSRVRCRLHRMAGRKDDILHLEIQSAVATAMGFGADVESFLARLHRTMSDIRLFCDLALEEPGNDRATTRLPPADPAEAMDLISRSLCFGATLDWDTRRAIRNLCAVLTPGGSWRKNLLPDLERLLCSPQAALGLTRMLETGLLEAVIPEFSAIRDMVQFDEYHLLPVGPHLIETIHWLTLDEARAPFAGAGLSVESTDPSLRWAALLHDLGKGNGDHAFKGADLASAILDGLGLVPERIAEVGFLVREHLLLVHTATRRDLSEEEVCVSLAHRVGSTRRLDLLVLLTWADSRATGPRAWNPWIAGLISELWLKTRKILAKGLLAGDHVMHRLATARDTLRSLGRTVFSKDHLERYLFLIPARSLLSFTPGEILDHLLLVQEFEQLPVGHPPFVASWIHEAEGRCWRLTLVAEDIPGLFARVAHALAECRLSVLSADLAGWDNGLVVDVFWITEPQDALYPDLLFGRVESILVSLMEFQDQALPEPISTRGSRKMGRFQDIKVRLDNDLSDFYTVLEIQAPDIPGLLSAVSQAIHAMDLDVAFARIATRADLAFDVFYLREQGQKIDDPNLPGIQNALQTILVSLWA
ncbi:MAG: HD domain-containing protein [Deltaproteobacteria bacterium]|nr:HD domain-containing protein [Deltaproteobacteria bacterium]